MAFNASLEILRLRKILLFHRIAILVLIIAIPIAVVVSRKPDRSGGSPVTVSDVTRGGSTDTRTAEHKYRMIPFAGSQAKLALPPWELNKFNDGINPERLVAMQEGSAILGDKKLSFSPLALLIRGSDNDIEIYFSPLHADFNFSEKYPVEIRFSGAAETMILPVSSGSKGSFFVPQNLVPVFLKQMHSAKYFRIKYFSTDESPVVTEYLTENIQGIVGEE